MNLNLLYHQSPTTSLPTAHTGHALPTTGSPQLLAQQALLTNHNHPHNSNSYHAALPSIPAKRKRSSNPSPSPAASAQIPSRDDAPLLTDGLRPPLLDLHQTQGQASDRSSWQAAPHTQAPPPPSSPPPASQVSEDISCICDYTHDDGNTIQCDRCRQWSHMTCYEHKQCYIDTSSNRLDRFPSD